MERNYPMTTRSKSESDRIVFYDNKNYYNERLPDFRDELISQGLYPPSPHCNRARRSNSVCTQSDRPKRFRTNEAGNRRRNSIHGRINQGTTPLGDGRRASVKRKVSARRTNSINRKNSTRQTNNNKTYHYRSDAETVNDDNKIKVVEKSLMELEQARKQRQIIIIILGIFVILVVTSVLIVIITLTRRSFRTSIATPRSSHHNYSMRLQNEELINSLHRHASTITNSTIPP